jgi:sporulation protein YlmC with PRC-barrel domain
VRKQVLYIPYNAIDAVGDAGVVLSVDEKKAKGWLAAPKWLSQA